MSKLNKGFTLFWFCYVFFSFIVSSNAVDIIAVNHAIQDGDTIVSAGDNFEMGFFSLGGSKNRYLGIWYKKLGGRTIVWVANRESPLATAGGVLRLSSNGSLQLFRGTDSRIWSSNSSTSVKNPVAQLLDTGNLVIREENDLDPGNYLWQSFDYPENTFLPDMKIGRDLVTGRDWSINSWKSNDDPSPGTYMIQFDMGGYPQLLLRQGSAVTFRVGPWNGIRFSGGSRFAEIPYLGPYTKFTYEFVLNEREIYFKYQLINSSVLVRLTMNPEGRTERFTWNDRTQGWQLYSTLQGDDCDLYAACGAYGSCDINKSPNACGCLKGFEPKYADAWAKADYSSGCVRKTQLNCTENDKFVKYLDKKLPDTRKSWYNVSMNLEECKRMCLKNCACTAYANMDIRGSGSGCFLWFGELIDMRDLDENEQDVYVRMPASYSEADRSSRVKRLVLIIVCPVVIILTLLLIRRFWFVFKYREEKREGTRLDVGHTGANENEREDLPMFEFRTIADATSNFSFNNKIGEGGFGPVYKGVLNGGQEIAVKRLSTSSSQGLEEFKNEVSCIAKLQHRNLVRLLGCCTKEGERMLIYEYMPNKSLDYFIFDNEQKKTLDWPKRYNIINGIARGLLYLHQDSRLRIIHRDLKASNILLDNEMNPRISDFGMARSFGGTETEGNTTRVVGTYGYMSPEYVIDGIFSIKSDVYSFGVLVLEILSGKRNKGFHHSDHNLNLLGHAWRLYNDWKFLDLIDGEIMESCNQSEAFRAIQIALLCVQQYPGDRPSMSLVVLMLTSKIELPEPKSPGFYTDRKLHETDVPKSSSSNQISVTLIVPR